MPIEVKDVVEFLGYKADDIKELNDLKTKFDSDFIRTANITEDSEPVKKFLGKTFGTLENEIKKVAKSYDLEIDFDSEDLKGKKVTDKLKFAFSKYDEKNKSVIDELKSKAAQGNDEKVKEWETKYEKLKSKFSDTDSLLKTTIGEYEEFKLKKDSEIKDVKLNVHKSNAYNKAKFIPDINEYTKKGFLTDFESKYIADLDETGKIIPMTKDGKRIQNPKVTGTFYEFEDLLQEEMIKANLYALNKDGGKPKPQTIKMHQSAEGSPVRQVAKRLG